MKYIKQLLFVDKVKYGANGKVIYTFDTHGWMYTLSPELPTMKEHQLGGWVVTGAICEDYYEWIEAFAAKHATHGIIQGDFNNKVIASSDYAFNHFLKHITPKKWDAMDI
jgi:hypothetical protein